MELHANYSVAQGVFESSGGGGNWSSSGEWTLVSGSDGDGVPDADDDVTIKAGNDITINVDVECNDITIESTASLTHSANDQLTVYGSYTTDGIQDFGNGNSNLILAGNDTVFGSGSLSSTGGIYFDTDYVIASSSTVTFEDDIILNGADVDVTNLGSPTLYPQLNLTGAGTWIQGLNSTFTFRGATLTCNLDAASVANTFNFNLNNNQNVPAGTYHHLTISNGLRKSLAGNITIKGDLDVQSNTEFDVTSNHYSINIAGNWNVASTGTFSEKSGTVTFDGSGTQTITAASGSETFHDLTINASASVVISSETYTLNVTGDFANSGSFDAQTNTVVFNGTNAQTIQGTTTFEDLTVDNTAGVSVASGTQSFIGTLTLTSGTFATNDAVTLVSNASGTARIAEITGGSISGDMTVQRYIDAGPDGWHFLSSAVANQEVDDWDDDFVTAGFVGSDFPSFSFTSMYYYDESVSGDKDNGYVAPTGTTSIGLAQGFDAYLGPVPLTIDVKGPVYTGAQSLPVTYTNSGSSDDDGWNLVGNPYPSTIDWDAGTWTKTNINNAVYVWDPDNKVYTSYVGGIGTNGGSRYIPSSQAFWVKANAASPVLDIVESVKATTGQSFFKQALPINPDVTYIKLRLTGNNHSYETGVRFHSQATDTFDWQYDAYLFSDAFSPAPELSSITPNGDLSINTLPSLSQHEVIPLRAVVKTSGNYTIDATEIVNIPMPFHITLKDKVTGVVTDVRANSSYTCFIADTSHWPRFELRIKSLIQQQYPQDIQMEVHDDMQTAMQVNIYPNPSNGHFILQLSESLPATISVYSIVGIKVHSGAANNHQTELDLSDQPRGTYTVRVAQGAEVHTQKIIIR